MTHPVYTFEIGCPACGGRVEHVAHGAPTNTRSAAVIHCHTCGIDGLVTVTVSMAYNRRDDIGGTRATSDTRRAKDRERKRNQRARQSATA